MTVRHKTEQYLDERFFEAVFKNEMNRDVADTVCDAFFAATDVYPVATQMERIGCMAQLLAGHDAADVWLAVADEVRRMTEPANQPGKES